MCKLKKAIYDLKQSSWAWFDKFGCIISEVGFQKYYSNHSIFIDRSSFGIVILTIYVDNILQIGSDVNGIEKTKEYFKTQFMTKDMNKPKYFIGI